MNLPRHRVLAAALLALSSLSAQAAERAPDRQDHSGWIAAQGNAALAELHAELVADLRQRLRPLLPSPVTVLADERRENGLQKVSADAAVASAQAL